MQLMKHSSRRSGFALIELLFVIAIIGFLALIITTAAISSREKAHDNSVRNAVRQMRWLAEEVYDTQGGLYYEWSIHDSVTDRLTLLHREVDEALGADPNDATWETTIEDNQDKDYCLSAPLKSEMGHYCIDATGVFSVTATGCQPQDETGPPLRCP